MGWSYDLPIPSVCPSMSWGDLNETVMTNWIITTVLMRAVNNIVLVM